MRRLFPLLLLAACSHAGAPASTTVFRPACTADAVWDGHSCVSQTPARTQLGVAAEALKALDVDAAAATLEQVGKIAPLDHAANVLYWEQKGIAAAYVDDVPGARTAFGMLLALDPGHYLSYTLSPKATFVFEEVRKQPVAQAPSLDVSWPRGGKVGDRIPLDIDVITDPRQLLARATVFLRARGEPTWRAADVPLGSPGAHRIVVPPITATRATSLELYVRGHDARGNEVLAWADAAHPREIPLRYEPPTPWYRKWWAITAGMTVLAVATGAIVYEATWAPPEKIGGTASGVR